MIEDGFTFSIGSHDFRPFTHGRKLFLRRIESTHAELYVVKSLNLQDVDFELQKAVFTAAMEWDQNADLKNLHDGLLIALKSPLLHLRTCEVCKFYWFDEDTGKITKRGDGSLLKRLAGTPLPCETNTGCAKGHHTNPTELNERNRQAWQHYLRHRHSGLTDEERSDAIVQRNWEVIGNLVDQYGIPSIHRGVPGTTG